MTVEQIERLSHQWMAAYKHRHKAEDDEEQVVYQHIMDIIQQRFASFGLYIHVSSAEEKVLLHSRRGTIEVSA